MNWDVFGPVYEDRMKRIPALQNVGIKSTILGPESFTPDGHPIVGEQINFPNGTYYLPTPSSYFFSPICVFGSFPSRRKVDLIMF